MENYRKSFIRNNRVKKISSEPDVVIKCHIWLASHRFPTPVLKDSCRSKYVKISSRSKFEQCSGLLRGQAEILFFQVKRYECIVGIRKACGEQSDFVEFAWNLVEPPKEDYGIQLLLNVVFPFVFSTKGVCLSNFRILGRYTYWWSHSRPLQWCFQILFLFQPNFWKHPSQVKTKFKFSRLQERAGYL